MKIGDIDIKKAYLGSLELTNKNAFVGEVPVIEGGGGIPIPTSVTTYSSASSSSMTTSAYEHDSYWTFSCRKDYGVSSKTTQYVEVTLPYECESFSYTINSYSLGYSSRSDLIEYTLLNDSTTRTIAIDYQKGGASRASGSNVSRTVTRPGTATTGDIWKFRLSLEVSGIYSNENARVSATIPKSVI